MAGRNNAISSLTNIITQEFYLPCTGEELIAQIRGVSQKIPLFLTDSLKRTRLILLVLLLVGIYGLSRTPFLSGKGSFSDTGLFPILLILTVCMHGTKPVFLA